MIPFDFEYYKPDTLADAIEIFRELRLQGKKALYYGGGTEIITGARSNRVYMDAVIDIKAIPECNILQASEHLLKIGSTISLTQVSEANIFPLLQKTVREIANHTARSKITVGGNILGRIFYREAVLPFLLSDCHVVLANEKGTRTVPIHQIFQQKLQLQTGEFLIQLHIDEEYGNLPFAHIKQTRDGKIGYPLVSVAALKKDDKIRIAFSGVCPFPFRSIEIEDILNNTDIAWQTRIDHAIRLLPATILHNIEGSAEYREFVLKHVIWSIFEQLEGEPT